MKRLAKFKTRARVPWLVSTLFCVLFALKAQCAAQQHNSAIAAPATRIEIFSPTAIVCAPDSKTLFIGCATTNQVIVLDLTSGKINLSTPLPAPVSGLALSPDGRRLYVSCAAPESRLCGAAQLT